MPTNSRALRTPNRQHNSGGTPEDYSEGGMDMFIDSDPPLMRTSTRSPLRNELTTQTDPDSCRNNEPLQTSSLEPLLNPKVTEQASKLLEADPLSKADPTQDKITDTVGAIAVDCRGNIAAASSSGGIGMKHRGRIGPAALVGIGTAVIPVDSRDPHKVSVATITSGTGELLATTMAASTCARRLYTLTKKSAHGGSEETDEVSAIHSFVENDFEGKREPVRQFEINGNAHKH